MAITPRSCAVCVALGCLVAIGPAHAAAQTVANMYDTAVVAREQARLASRVNEVWNKAFKPNLTPDEQRALSGVTFETPLDGDPVLGYYSRSRSRVVTMPAPSLPFFEDLLPGGDLLFRQSRGLSVGRRLAGLPFQRGDPPSHRPEAAALSSRVSALAEDFARGQPNRAAAIETTRMIGDRFAEFAKFLDDPTLQRVMRAKAERSAPATLLPRRERETITDFPVR
jgi:hypothetical protein